MTFIQTNTSHGNGVDSEYEGRKRTPRDIPTDYSRTSYSDFKKTEPNAVSFSRQKSQPKLSRFSLEKFSEKIEADPEIRKVLNEAFALILDAGDTSYDTVERSNFFDEWRGLLKTLSRGAKHFSVCHNAILGSVLVATNKKDVWDFQPSVINLFREATNLLRQQKLNQTDINRVINALVEKNAVVTWPLYDVEDSSLNIDERLEELQNHLKDIY